MHIKAKSVSIAANSLLCWVGVAVTGPRKGYTRIKWDKITRGKLLLNSTINTCVTDAHVVKALVVTQIVRKGTILLGQIRPLIWVYAGARVLVSATNNSRIDFILWLSKMIAIFWIHRSYCKGCDLSIPKLLPARSCGIPVPNTQRQVVLLLCAEVQRNSGQILSS